jgi:hypothetical protein
MFQSTIQRAVKLVSETTDLLDLQRAKHRQKLQLSLGSTMPKFMAQKLKPHRVSLMSKGSEARIKREEGKQVIGEETEREGKSQRWRQEWEAAGHEIVGNKTQKEPEEKGEEDNREEWRFWEREKLEGSDMWLLSFAAAEERV